MQARYASVNGKVAHAITGSRCCFRVHFFIYFEQLLTLLKKRELICSTWFKTRGQTVNNKSLGILKIQSDYLPIPITNVRI